MSDITDLTPDMRIGEIHYKRWRIEVLQGEPGWKTLVYRPNSALHGAAAPDGSDRRAILEEVKTLIDEGPAS